MNEIWKDIIGYEGLYQVSSIGNVKSLNYNKTRKIVVLKNCLRLGYPVITLCNKGKYGINSTFSKQVSQYTKSGEFILEWGSMADVQRQLGINRKYISMCCRGKIKTSGGFIWKFKI